MQGGITVKKSSARPTSLLNVVDVYFTGKNVKLQRGQPLCWESHAAGGTAWDMTLTTFGQNVALPEHGVDESLFAGIVAPESQGVVGPAWIRMIIPQKGDVLEVYVASAATAAAGDMLAFSSLGGTAASQTDYSTTTTGWGCFNKATYGAGSTGSGATLLGAVTEVLPKLVGQLLASIASTANSRALRWVKFL